MIYKHVRRSFPELEHIVGLIIWSSVYWSFYNIKQSDTNLQSHTIRESTSISLTLHLFFHSWTFKIWRRRWKEMEVRGLKTQKGTWRGTRETHWTDALVINSCLCSGSIYYAVILAALPRDTPQNEISSPQTPHIWIELFQLPLTHYRVYVWLCTCVWASIVRMCLTDIGNLLCGVQVGLLHK